MTVLVTGCHDCPMMVQYQKQYYCSNEMANNFDVADCVKAKSIPTSCPLQTESITIKKKDNDDTGIHTERG